MDSTYILLQHYWWVSGISTRSAISIPSFCTRRPISTLHYRQDGDTAKNVIELDRA